MGGNENLVMADITDGAGREVFALTDEQILEIEPEAMGGEEGKSLAGAREDRGENEKARDDRKEQDDVGKGLRPEGLSYRAEPPRWLAREMKDPWVGEEARELWEGVQRAQREAAEFREVIGSPEEARALKEIYPGGVAEAKSAAERARELGEIDALFFGAAGKPAEVVRAGRMQLVERLHAQDPAAFREMVEAGVQLLAKAGSGSKVASGEWRVASGREENGSFAGARDDRFAASGTDTGLANGSNRGADSGAQPGMAVPQEVALRYREFERAANAELERSVGGAIGRAMEAALPNLKWADQGARVGRDGPLDDRGKQGTSLQERLQAAVREDVEAALRSDASLGEQVARVLSGRRLDEAARAQVVRLIDARAQQLVPGAVRRVVGSWTQATLGSRKADAGAESGARSEEERRAERPSGSSRQSLNGTQAVRREERSTAKGTVRGVPRGRMDYRKYSDEQILEM